jgi:hypothetical protein
LSVDADIDAPPAVDVEPGDAGGERRRAAAPFQLLVEERLVPALDEGDRQPPPVANSAPPRASANILSSVW